MRGRVSRAARIAPACLLIIFIMAVSTMPASAAHHKGGTAGTVLSALRQVRTSYIPGLFVEENTTRDGQFTLRGSGLKTFPDSDHICFSVRPGEEPGDERTYDAVLHEDGTCVCRFDIGDFGHVFGRYEMELLVIQGDKVQVIASVSADLAGDNYAYAADDGTSGSAATLRIVSPHIGDSAARSVSAVIASRDGGKDDREKLNLTQISDGVWEATAASTAFDAEGAFNARFYTGAVELTSLDFEMTKPLPEASGKAIALTFDDGPGAQAGKILRQLKKYDAHATFFVTGTNAEKRGATLKKIIDAGCEIGNHSYGHEKLGSASAKKIRSQLQPVSDIVREYTGTTPTLVRPPYGDIGDELRKYAQAPLILWDIDTLDWKTRDAKTTIRKVLKQAKDGDIILMHDIHEESVKAAVKLIPKLKKKGFDLVTVSELATLKGEKLENGIAYGSFREGGR